MSSEEDVLALAQRIDTLSYFQVLGLPHRFINPPDVKQAFHTFAELFHPDLFCDADEQVKQAAKDVFKRAVESYEVLRDKAQQRRYVEAYLTKGKLRLPPEEFSRRAAIAAGGVAPENRPKPPPPAPEPPRTWADQMKTEDGREVAERIERMIKENRLQAAFQQLGILESIEPQNPAVKAKVELVKRRMGVSR